MDDQFTSPYSSCATAEINSSTLFHDMLQERASIYDESTKRYNKFQTNVQDLPQLLP